MVYWGAPFANLRGRARGVLLLATPMWFPKAETVASCPQLVAPAVLVGYPAA